MRTTEEKYQFMLLSLATSVNGLGNTPAMSALADRFEALEDAAGLATTEDIDAAIEAVLGTA